jgi:DNA-binding CsgD family transcriptional regulator
MSRYLTLDEKVQVLESFAESRVRESSYRRFHAEARGGEGYIDHEVLPLVDALNVLDGVCTVQSCCGHINRHGYRYPGSLWIRLSEQVMKQFEFRVWELVHISVIEHVTKLYHMKQDNRMREVVSVQFTGEPNGKMQASKLVIVDFFQKIVETPIYTEAGPNDELPPTPGGNYCPLTEREIECIAWLAEGLVYKNIATKMNLSVSTIRTHLHNSYNKLGVVDRAQAVLKAKEQGWI